MTAGPEKIRLDDESLLLTCLEKLDGKKKSLDHSVFSTRTRTCTYSNLPALATGRRRAKTETGRRDNFFVVLSPSFVRLRLFYERELFAPRLAGREKETEHARRIADVTHRNARESSSPTEDESACSTAGEGADLASRSAPLYPKPSPRGVKKT